MMCVLVSKAHYNQYFNAESIASLMKPLNETKQTSVCQLPYFPIWRHVYHFLITWILRAKTLANTCIYHTRTSYHIAHYSCKNRCSLSQNIRQATIIAVSDDSSHILHRSKMKLLIGKLVCVLNKMSYLMYIELHESNSFVLEAHQVRTEQDIKCLKKWNVSPTVSGNHSKGLAGYLLQASVLL